MKRGRRTDLAEDLVELGGRRRPLADGVAQVDQILKDTYRKD